MIKCLFCGEHVEQFDVTGGGSGYPAFDYPAAVNCEKCGAVYVDGDLNRFPNKMSEWDQRAALSKFIEHVDE